MREGGADDHRVDRDGALFGRRRVVGGARRSQECERGAHENTPARARRDIFAVACGNGRWLHSCARLAELLAGPGDLAPNVLGSQLIVPGVRWSASGRKTSIRSEIGASAKPESGDSAGEAAPVVRRIWGPAPLARLAMTHACGSAGDAFFTVSLAGSLFFNVSVGAARPRVLGYLALTLAPFIVLAPLVGPLVDRFGRAERLVAASTCLGRGIICLLVAGDIRNLLLYPEAFGVLVLEKAYSITKSALVPHLVPAGADLVSANSRLARISTVAGLLGGSLAAVLLHFSGTTPILRLASIAFFAAAVFALRIPADDVAHPAAGREPEERQFPPIRFAAGAMAVMRATIGFVVFLVAFSLKRAGEPTWFFGVVAAASIAGGFAGNVVSPLLRRGSRRNEPLLAIALSVAALVSFAASIHIGRPSVTAAVFAIAVAASVGRQGFESILQRDAPSASRAQAFARFEALFQLSWAIGAVGAVVLLPGTRTGLVLLGIVLAGTLTVYAIGIGAGSRPSS